MILPSNFPNNFRAALSNLNVYKYNEKIPFNIWCWQWIHTNWYIVKEFDKKDPNFTRCLHKIKMTPNGGARVTFAITGGTVAYSPKQGGIIKAMEIADSIVI